MHGRTGIGTTGSHVPCLRPDHARAASMPDTTWAVDRYPPGSSRAICAQPGSDVVYPISTRHRRFAFARLRGPYLTDWQSAFSATLTTPAFPPAQLAAVCSLLLQGGCGGSAPPSQTQHHLLVVRSYIRTPFDVRGAPHARGSSAVTRRPESGDRARGNIPHRVLANLPRWDVRMRLDRAPLWKPG